MCGGCWEKKVNLLVNEKSQVFFFFFFFFLIICIYPYCAVSSRCFMKVSFFVFCSLKKNACSLKNVVIENKNVFNIFSGFYPYCI